VRATKTRPIGPPNTVRWDLKLAYAEIGNPEKHWFNLRVGPAAHQLQQHHHRQLGMAQPGPLLRCGGVEPEREARAPGHLRRLGRGAAGLRSEPASGRQQHLRSLRRIDNFLVPHSNIEPFVLWRVQPAEVVEPAVAKTTGKEDEKAFGVRLKGQVHPAFDYSGEVIFETGTVGSQSIQASAAQAGAAYQFLNVVAKPRVFAQYDYATGNSNPNRTERTPLRHNLPDSPRPLWNHRPFRLAKH